MLSELFNSDGYKNFIRKLIWMALVVIVIGAMLRLTHLNGGYIMMLCGGGVMLFIGLLKLIERITQ